MHNIWGIKELCAIKLIFIYSFICIYSSIYLVELIGWVIDLMTHL